MSKHMFENRRNKKPVLRSSPLHFWSCHHATHMSLDNLLLVVKYFYGDDDFDNLFLFSSTRYQTDSRDK